MRPPHAFGIGDVFRFPDAHDKQGKQSGWAVYYEYTTEEDIIGICVFGSWRGDPEKVVWSNKRPDHMTTHEKAEFNQRIEHAKAIVDAARKVQHDKAAQECADIWAGAAHFDATPYTLRKGIVPKGAKLHNNTSVLLPIFGPAGIMSLQYINQDGEKKFHTGGKVSGGYMVIEGEGDAAYVTEGWATACTIHEATGATVYVAYTAGNLSNTVAVAREEYRTIIAADDDRFTPGNPGMKAARSAADMHSCEVVCPSFKSETEGTDFNDMHAQMGIGAVSELLSTKPEVKPAPIAAPRSVSGVPPGALDTIYKYYNATSGNHQPGFAMQTALAITSVMCGRYFKTDEENRTTLYFLNVGKSSTGKEHAKSVIDKIFYETGMEHLLAGDGFTSAGAVMSLLMAKPRALTVIDEFGRYLEASGSVGNTGQREANTTLMEAISRPGGILRPKNYSTMTLKKDAADEMRDRYIYNPAMTLLGITTPVTFFDQIKLKSVLDGFLGRFIVSVSDEQRGPRKRTNMVEVPESLKDWVSKINARIKKNNVIEAAQTMPDVETIYFTDDAKAVQEEFELEMLDLQNSLEKVKLDALPGRANEFAMRMALICALSRDPETFEIEAADMQWSVNYMRASVNRLLAEVRDNVSETYVDASKKEILTAIRDTGARGVQWCDMQNKTPYSKYSQKDLKDALLSLVDAELIVSETKKTPGRGRPGVIYHAVG